MKHIKEYLVFAGGLVAILWVIEIIDLLPFLHLEQYGIRPRRFWGILGIVFAPFLHAGLPHLISNSIPLFILTLTLLIFYERISLLVLAGSILIGGALVWIFARPANHIGASGLIYSLAAFLIASGIIRRDFKAVVVAIIIFFLYGGLIWGVFPSKPWVSWEGHLFGAISGVGMAYFLRSSKAQDDDDANTSSQSTSLTSDTL